MAIPQFHSEGPDQTGGSANLTLTFTGLTWSANDIIEIIIATDGWTPSLTTANGFVLAQDPLGNTASQTTNGTTVGTAECGIHVYWKRAVGSTTTTDPVPVFAAPSGVSGTAWAVQINSFSGVRTSGTPYTVIAKGIVSTATTAVTSQAATWSLANCLLMPRVASSNDDSAFNNWTMSGSSGPSGSGAPNTGWHTSTGNACAFTGAEGGYATAQTGKTATTTFATSTKQAMVTLVMASLAEAASSTVSGTIAGAPGATSGSVAATATVSGTATGDAGATSGTATVNAGIVSGAALGDTGSTIGSAAVSSAVSGTAIGASGSSSGSIGLPLGSSGAALGSAGTSSGSVTASIVVVGLDTGSAGTTSGAANVSTGTLLTGASQGAPGNSLASATVTLTASGAATGTPGVATSSADVATTVNGSDTGVAGATTGSATTAVGLALGATAFIERANTATPNTGTLTTKTVYPAWTPSTGYAIRTDDRVTNAGNTYECANSANTGTSASSGGPTTTPAPVTNGAITDGSTHWNFLAAGTGAVDTGTSDGLILVSLGQGNDAGSGGTAPTDNKGNTYSQVIRSTFAGFPQSSAVTWASGTPAAGGTGHTFSAPWTAGLDGGGDEKTIAAVKIVGAALIKDHSSIEATPVANVCTSNPVTTTGPAVLVCFCWLNGTTHSDGFLHVATPGSGFSLLPNASGLLEIGNGAGQVHMCTIARIVASAGTFTASLTTAAGEGAVMQMFAVQASDPPPTRTATGTVAGGIGIATGSVLVGAGLTGSALGRAGSTSGTTVASISAVSLAAGAPGAASGTAAAGVSVAGTVIGAPGVTGVNVTAVALSVSGAALGGGGGSTGLIDTSARNATGSAQGTSGGANGELDTAIACSSATIGAAGSTAAVALVAATASASAIGVAGVALGAAVAGVVATGQGVGAPGTTIGIVATADRVISGSAVGEQGAVLAGAAVDVMVSGAAIGSDGSASGTSTAIVPVDPTAAWEDAIYQWVLTGSGLAASQIIWASSGGGGPSPTGLYISMRVIDVDQVSDDWLIYRREGGGIVEHQRGTRHPTLELRCFAGESTGARRAELVLSRVLGSVMLSGIAKALRIGRVGVGEWGKIRVINGTRSGMFDPLAMVEVQLHVSHDVSAPIGEFVSVDVTTPGGVVQSVVKP